jgi:hypothetical protein
MLPPGQSTAFDLAASRQAWLDFERSINEHNMTPTVSVIFDAKNRNVECLMALGAVDGLWSKSPDGLSDEEYARSFLIAHSALFRLYPEVFTDYLVLKHVLHSLVGTHLIFDLRVAGSNLEDVGFTVHLDRQRHIVMVCAAYDPDRTYDGGQIDLINLPIGGLQAVLKDRQPRGGLDIERVWLADSGRASRYMAAWRFKLLDQNNTTWYCLTDQDHILTEYAVDPEAAPSGYGVGRLFASTSAKRGELPAAQWVVLRDLTSDRELAGRYVVVQDEIDPTSPRWSEFDANTQLSLASSADEDRQLPLPGKFVFSANSTRSDRVIAYYHTDRVQRYFRELGLAALDDYPALNPIKVRLSRAAKTQFINSDQCIQLALIPGAKRRGTQPLCTQAREPRVIYHEFTHAVTDSLARLQRGNWTDGAHRRHWQLLQAAAMDEGLADYFACSLAARSGDADPKFALLKIAFGRIVYDIDQQRMLTLQQGETEWLKPILQPEPADFAAKRDGFFEGLKYDWGTRWGKFLWQLRTQDKIGAEAADLLVATSLFFLTRWSTIVGGVLALLQADQLLFGGVHRRSIGAIAQKGAIDLETYSLRQFIQTQIDQPALSA